MVTFAINCLQGRADLSDCFMSLAAALRIERTPFEGGPRLTEYLRPWKLFSLACGVALLIAGAYYYEAPDWDVPISLIMAALAYLTAPWSMRVMLERRWKQWPAMILLTWFTVDGSYWLYWRAVDPVALEMMRDANWPASLSLYWTCGMTWLYRGSLRELLAEVQQVLRDRNTLSRRKGEVAIVRDSVKQLAHRGRRPEVE